MQKLLCGMAVGLGLLAAMETAVGSLPLAAWRVRLVDSEVIRVPTQPLRLTLPSELPDHARTALQFELNGIRITEQVTLLDDAAVYRPTEPLAPGTHRLLMAYAPAEGHRRELGVWHFRVVADSRITGKPAVKESYAAVSPAGSPAQLELQVTSSAATGGPPSVLPAVDTPGAASDKLVATLRSGSMLARVGPQSLAYDSFIHKDRTDQGAVVAFELGRRTRVKGFGVQSNARRGYQRLLGSDRADYEINGMVVETRLPEQEGAEINLVAGWLSGVAHAGGSDEETAGHAGNAWSVAADTSLLEKRLRLNFEYAGSRYEWKHPIDGTETLAGDSGGFAEQTGRAYGFGTEFHSSASSSITWHLGTEFDQVTPWFGSLANPTLTNDWRRVRTYGLLSAGEWSLDLSLDQRQSNLEDRPALPTVQTDKGRLLAEWVPSEPILGLFPGKQSYKFSADYTRHEKTIAGAPGEPERSDERAVSLMLQTEFLHTDWLWGVRAKGGKKPGSIDADAGAGVRTLALHLYGDIGASALKPAVSWQRSRDEVTGTTDDRWRAGLSSADIVLRNYLKAGVKLGYQHRLRSDVGRGEDGFNLGANLEWQLKRPASGRSGLTLAVSGSYLGGDRGLAGPAGKDDYRFMVSLSTTDPVAAQ